MNFPFWELSKNKPCPNGARLGIIMIVVVDVNYNYDCYFYLILRRLFCVPLWTASIARCLQTAFRIGRFLGALKLKFAQSTRYASFTVKHVVSFYKFSRENIVSNRFLSQYLFQNQDAIAQCLALEPRKPIVIFLSRGAEWFRLLIHQQCCCNHGFWLWFSFWMA